MDNLDSQRLTKKERKLLKRQEKNKEHLQLIRRKKIKKIIVISLPLILIVGWIVYGLVNYSPEENKSHSNSSSTPKIEVNPQEFDAGTVSMAAGLVKHTYEVKNNGEGDLEISDMKTSCMCTTSVLKVGDKKSPKFGMHNNPKFWSGKIAPGQTGYLEVTFDPAFHGPQGTGPVVRAIYLSTNDPKKQEAEVRLLANVVP